MENIPGCQPPSRKYLIERKKNIFKKRVEASQQTSIATQEKNHQNLPNTYTKGTEIQSHLPIHISTNLDQQKEDTEKREDIVISFTDTFFPFIEDKPLFAMAK